MKTEAARTWGASLLLAFWLKPEAFQFDANELRHNKRNRSLPIHCGPHQFLRKVVIAQRGINAPASEWVILTLTRIRTADSMGMRMVPLMNCIHSDHCLSHFGPSHQASCNRFNIEGDISIWIGQNESVICISTNPETRATNGSQFSLCTSKSYSHTGEV